MNKFNYNFTRTVEPVVEEKVTPKVTIEGAATPDVINCLQEQLQNMDNVGHIITTPSFDAMLQEKRRILSDKYNELNDEYIYRGQQLEKLSAAIKALDVLADVDNFVV